MRVSPNFGPQLSWQLFEAMHYCRIVELPQEPLVFIGEAGLRCRHLAKKPFQLGKRGGCDLHPLTGDLNEGFGEVAIEGVLATICGLIALPLDHLKASGTTRAARDLISEGFVPAATRAVTAA